MTKYRRCLRILFPLVLLGGAGVVADFAMTGRTLDAHRGVAVRHNGMLYFRSHGRSHAADGRYLGQKWQCVEYVKRFYEEAHHHRMPDGTGHAKDFFDPAVPHGAPNRRRGMLQFTNGEDAAPRVDDLLVFRTGTYGHVAVISAVEADEVEVIQQNIYGRPRQRFPLGKDDGGRKYTIGGGDHAPAGWLRLAPTAE